MRNEDGGTLPPLKVLYIVAKGRSGSTILNTVLGQIEGLFSVGELVHLWEWGLIKNRNCGCGKRFVDCPVWSTVLRMLSTTEDLAAERYLTWQREVLSWGKLPKVLRQRPDKALEWTTLCNYAVITSKLYRAIMQATNAKCIVESTKLPTAPTALGLVPNIDSYFVHLVRDPRAVVYSWQRTKSWDLEGNEAMPRFGPVYTTASWWMRNLLAEIVTKRRGSGTSILVRYEDFVSRPQSVINRILCLIGEPRSDVPDIENGSIIMHPTHSVAGNVSRFESGTLRLKLDDAWIQRQPPSHRFLATALAIPFLQRYGYPIRGAGSRSKG
jgi:hypothetical protein